MQTVRRTELLMIPAILLLVLLTACSGSDPDTTDAPSTATPEASPTHATSGVPVDEPSIDGQFAVASNGRELALVCWGTGSPTVLLETGGTNIEEWTGSGVVDELASFTRVCTYDRAGTGNSDPAPHRRRDADDVVTDAQALLAAAQVDGPLVLVGRSFGGMIVTHYTEVMPENVIGVVVLDTPAPSAEFTEENAPDLVWNFPDNTEHLDVVNGFENRFANEPPQFDVPLLLITPMAGESSPNDQSFWLQTSPQSRQVTCDGEPDEGGPCVARLSAFVENLDTSP